MPFLGFLEKFHSSERHYRKSLKKILGFTPSQIHLYRLAFTHRSLTKLEKGGTHPSNERLEFLGDAVLSAIVADLLFCQFPENDEGFLTEMRSKLVNRMHLNQVSEKLGIRNFLEFDPRAFPRMGPSGSLLGDALEALLGAIYLDKGFQVAFDFYKKKIFESFITLDDLTTHQINFKSKLIEWGQRNGKEVRFETLISGFESPMKLFEIRVMVAGNDLGLGREFTKKNAEKKAAEIACQALNI